MVDEEPASGNAPAPATLPIREPERILVPVVQAPRSAFQAGFWGALGAMAAIAWVGACLIGVVLIVIAITSHGTTSVHGLTVPAPTVHP